MRKLLLLLGIAISVIGCNRPPLRVVQEGVFTIIDMQTLGEYPSDVIGMRIIDVSRSAVVWEVRGRDVPQIGLVKLTVGENPTVPADVRHGTYEVVTPAGKETFTIAPGTHYVVEVWSSETALGAKQTAQFSTSAAARRD